MAYKVIILYRLYMPSYFLGTFTEYPYILQFVLVTRFLLLFCQYTFRMFQLPFVWK